MFNMEFNNLGITFEEYKVIKVVNENYDKQFEQWARENESELMKWHDSNKGLDVAEAIMKFAYYCADKFIAENVLEGL